MNSLIARTLSQNQTLHGYVIYIEVMAFCDIFAYFGQRKPGLAMQRDGHTSASMSRDMCVGCSCWYVTASWSSRRRRRRLHSSPSCHSLRSPSWSYCSTSAVRVTGSTTSSWPFSSPASRSRSASESSSSTSAIYTTIKYKLTRYALAIVRIR